MLAICFDERELNLKKIANFEGLVSHVRLFS